MTDEDTNLFSDLPTHYLPTRIKREHPTTVGENILQMKTEINETVV